MHRGRISYGGTVQGDGFGMNSMNNELPNSVEAEQNILGALMLNNDLLDRGSAILTPEVFYDPVHADIFSAITRRIEQGNVASPVTIKGDFSDHDGLRQLGGPAYLARLAGASLAAFAFVDYA